jgi:hypothetical protein
LRPLLTNRSTISGAGPDYITSLTLGQYAVPDIRA